jgi:tetratricopeptide (TPR) repeat protein
MGLLAQQAGEYPEAVRLLEQALALNRDDRDTLNNLAEAYIGQRQNQSARQCYQRLAELFPQSAEVHHRLGMMQERLGDWGAAMESYRRAVVLQPDLPEHHSSLGALQYKQGAYTEAVESCRRALALDPDQPQVLTQLGHALTDLSDYPAAANAFERALALKPDSAPAISGLGHFFERKGDLRSAVESYRTALKFDPEGSTGYLRLGCVQILQDNLEEATECFERVRQLTPDSAEARAFLGIIHLRQGNFRLGLSEYEDRWTTQYGYRFRRELSQPRWNGEPLAGARILLHAEQGIGDTLQFVRYVPLVAALGAEVILEVQPPVHRLLASTPGAAKVICRDDVVPEVDWQCPLLSLPLVLGTELNTIPAKVPYVYANPDQAETWRQRMAVNSLRVGLVWGGNPIFPHELWRAIPLAQLAPLTHLEGTTFYSLQVGPPAGQMKALEDRVRLIDLQKELKDFGDTAAVVANLDLVIAMDTSVAHLVGAMGKPVWILLHKSADWRWFMEREDSPWYPTARLFRQSTLGNWQDVVARVERELREFVVRTAAARTEGDRHE